MAENDTVTDTQETEDKDFFNIFDGTNGRVNSRYLDMEERISAERTRAMQEDREPELSDLGALPAAVGTPFVVKSQVPDNRYYSNPATATIEAATGEVKDVDPAAVLPVGTGEAEQDIDLGYAAQVASERSAQDEALAGAASPDEDGDLLNDANFNTNDTTV